MSKKEKPKPFNRSATNPFGLQPGAFYLFQLSTGVPEAVAGTFAGFSPPTKGAKALYMFERVLFLRLWTISTTLTRLAKTGPEGLVLDSELPRFLANPDHCIYFLPCDEEAWRAKAVTP